MREKGITITKLFMRFLKENKILNTYKNDLVYFYSKNYRDILMEQNYNYITLINNGLNIPNFIALLNSGDAPINYAMTWRCTKKGYDFWENIDYMWKEYFSSRW